MTSYADLEIGLYRRDADSYMVDMRFTQPDSDVDTRLLEESPALTFDVKSLRRHHLNDEDYGQTLAETLFGPEVVRDAFKTARQNVQALDARLRVRLFLDPGAPELHSLRWETLRDPQHYAPLLTGEEVIFSRYLSSYDWRPVRLRAQSELKALVVIANPADLDPKRLSPVDVEGELARAKAGLGAVHVTALASQGQASLNQLTRYLREGYDVLYLVCHGALEADGPQLWLENETGRAHVVLGDELVTRLLELDKRPRLVVLVSCQSAGRGRQQRSDDRGALAALGPRLAEAGIPAVLAMQGNITVRTVETFMPVFFSELGRDGRIDRAVSVARGAVRDRPDWWMPVLFTRLKGGQLWYKPGFGEETELINWSALLESIYQRECTPILGPGLTEPLFGTRLELAHRLADESRFPMAPHARDDLPQVGQYVAVTEKSELLVPRKFSQHLFQEIVKRYPDVFSDVSDVLHPLAEKYKLPDKELIPAIHELTKRVGEYRRQQMAAEPHHVLARLPIPIYITTDPGNALADALEAAGKTARVELCRWNSLRFKDIPSVFDVEPDYVPDQDHPLVYHLFGHINQPKSLVLTEDEYFDYLIGVTREKDLVPDVVRAALANSALLFLGFQMDDWNFRVLLRSIMAQEGSESLKLYAHIAAQITPEEGRILEPARARQYLETYFQANEPAAISIYWGSTEDFITDLHQKWDWRQGQPRE